MFGLTASAPSGQRGDALHEHRAVAAPAGGEVEHEQRQEPGAAEVPDEGILGARVRGVGLGGQRASGTHGWTVRVVSAP